MQMGKVTFWNTEKAYGFIRPDDGGADQFVHITGLTDGITELSIGQRVEFDTSFDQSKGKEKAHRVRVI